MSTAMTRQEKEAFLAAVHVGVLSIPRKGQALLTVPVWYGYEELVEKFGLSPGVILTKENY